MTESEIYFVFIEYLTFYTINITYISMILLYDKKVNAIFKAIPF